MRRGLIKITQLIKLYSSAILITIKMKTKTLLLFLLLLANSYSVLFAQTTFQKTEELKASARSNFADKKYDKAKSDYLQLFSIYNKDGDYAQAVEYGLIVNSINLRERNYNDVFDMFRVISQLVRQAELKNGKPDDMLNYKLARERLIAYQQLKRADLAYDQLNRMDGFAENMKNDSINYDLLTRQMSNSFIFGDNQKGEAYLKELEKRKGQNSRNANEIENYYVELFNIAQIANNANFTHNLYQQYITWKDSVNQSTLEINIAEKHKEYNRVSDELAEKESKIGTQRFIIIVLCVLLIALGVIALVLFLAQMRLVLKNKKIKKLMAVADERNERHTAFIHNVSNQLTPAIDKIKATGIEIEEIARPQAQIIESETSALNRYLAHIKQLSQLENEVGQLYEVKSINLKSLFDDIDTQIRPMLKEGVALTLDTPKMQIDSNVEHLRFILLHLLKNAVKYTNEGHIKVEFKKRGARSFQFLVTDTGSGIDAQLQNKLFKPFELEAENLVDGDKLGLPICHLMALKLNGNLTLDSAYKRGCRFILELH